jgi:hypothetical protein
MPIFTRFFLFALLISVYVIGAPTFTRLIMKRTWRIFNKFLSRKKKNLSLNFFNDLKKYTTLQFLFIWQLMLFVIFYFLNLNKPDNICLN